MGYLSKMEVENLKFATVGENVYISDKASIYNPHNISIGSNVRIDDFCILSAGTGGIKIGNNVHIACYVSLIGNSEILVEDFVGISSKSAIYSSSDDYSGEFLSGPTIPLEYKKVDSRTVILKTHSIIGAGCVILPGVIIGEGTAIGSLSLVTKSVEEWKIFGGTPLKFLKK